MSAVASVINLARIGALILLEAPFRPRWAWYRLRNYANRYLFNRRHQDRTGEYESRIRPLFDAVAHVTGRDEQEVRSAAESDLLNAMVVQDRWVVSLAGFSGDSEAKMRERGPIEVGYGPSPEMMTLIHVTCRLLRPKHVVETGVGKGFVSTAVLAALEGNQSGQLHSIELPSLYTGFADQVGERIPHRLRRRWTLVFGPSALALPQIVDKVGSVDLFVHDSAANYHNQIMEYRIALARMPSGGVLVSNTLNSNAFLEAAESVRCRWAVVRQTKAVPLGILCKLEPDPATPGMTE